MRSDYLYNSHSLGTILVSDDSFLLLNEDTEGLDNFGVVDCEGSWLMESNSTCNEISCPGTCCEFGDFTCDLTPDTQSPSVSSAPSVSASMMPSSPSFNVSSPPPFFEPSPETIATGITEESTSGILRPQTCFSLCAVLGTIFFILV